MEEMGKLIKRLRLEKGMTLEELGNKVGVGKSTVRKWENGTIANMRRDKIAKVANALDISPAFLMGWTENTDTINHKSSQAPKNSYEHLIVAETKKLNQKGKMKLLDTAREMVCNPLYNPDYKIEVAAAHERTDIEVTEEMRKHDDNIMMNDSEWE